MIDVVSVDNRTVQAPALKSAAVDAPEAGTTLSGYSIEIAGHAVVSPDAGGRVEILSGDALLRSATLVEPRAGSLGVSNLRGGKALEFRTRINLIGLPVRPTLRVVVVVEGERREVGTVSLQRDLLRVTPPPPIHPLVVTTPGRTGSVWFSRLVGEHPAIVSYRPFEAEPRVGSYWAHAFRALADPASVMQSLRPLEMRGTWWLGSETTENFPRVPDPEVSAWLVERHPERVARFCLESASDFYERVAALQQKPGVVYYAEKYAPSWVPTTLLELDPGAKEVFLVRDPRDQLASVVSWTEAGRAQFSAEAKTAEEYADWLTLTTKLHLRHWQARSAHALLVRYEDLILAPEQTLTRLFDYLGVDSSAETVAAVTAKARQATPSLQRQHQTSTSAEKSVGRWRRDVDPKLWPKLEEVFAPELEAWYGDAPAG